MQWMLICLYQSLTDMALKGFCVCRLPLPVDAMNAGLSRHHNGVSIHAYLIIYSIIGNSSVFRQLITCRRNSMQCVRSPHQPEESLQDES